MNPTATGPAAPEAAATARAARTPPPVPDVLRFASPESRTLIHVSLAAIRESQLLGPAIRQALTAVSEQLPDCDTSLWNGADRLLVAVSTGERPDVYHTRIRVLGGFEHQAVRRCLRALSAAGLFQLRELAAGAIQIIDDSDTPVVDLRWIDRGIELRTPDGPDGEGGPSSPHMHAMIAEVALDSPVWAVITTDGRLDRHTDDGHERFERAWLEITSNAQLTLRAAMKFHTRAGAEEVPRVLVDAILQGIQGRVPLDAAAIRKRVKFRTEDDWVHLEAAWSYEELRDMLGQMVPPAAAGAP